jgi:DNA-binding MarR family transcriptional regulator
VECQRLERRDGRYVMVDPSLTLDRFCWTDEDELTIIRPKAPRLSRLQRRLLAWLAAEDQRTRGTMSASHADLVRALAHDKGNLSISLHNLEAKGLVRITRTPGGRAEAVDLTAEGRNRVPRWRQVVNKDISV